MTLLLSCPAGAIYLSSYDFAKDNLQMLDLNPVLFHLSCGALAEGTASILFTPMDVLKQKLQVQPKAKTFAIVKDLYRTHGLNGFYKGYAWTQAVFIPFSAIYFASYERFKSAWIFYSKSTNHDFTSNFICAFSASAIASGLTSPIDVIKTRLQIDTRKSAKQVISHLYYNEGGLRAFSKGLLARVLWASPSMSLSIALWEMGKRMVE